MFGLHFGRGSPVKRQAHIVELRRDLNEMLFGSMLESLHTFAEASPKINCMYCYSAARKFEQQNEFGIRILIHGIIQPRQRFQAIVTNEKKMNALF